MPSCEIYLKTTYLSPKHEYATIYISAFDITKSEVIELTKDILPDFMTDVLSSESIKQHNVNRSTVLKVNNIYVRPTMISENPYIKIECLPHFFNICGASLEELCNLLAVDSTLPLLYTNCNSLVYSGLCKLLCRVSVRSFTCQ